jgi:mono/diheme cytochrome c family protein
MTRTFAVVTAVFLAALGFRAAAQSGPTRTADGQRIFRFDTFGDEQLWTSTLHLDQAVANVSPATALSVGLKVDSEALPAPVADAIRAGRVDLNDPAVTIALLKLNAVVGVVGKVNEANQLESVGVTCALCHSTVDDSFARGIGRRLDGWPNRDLNVGAIVALSPVLTPAQRAVFNSWGPGRYDPRLQAFDGTSFIPLNSSTLPVEIPPAYGLRHVGFETVTADGPVSYWNDYVAVSQMGGHGSFSDSRIGLTITQTPDLVTPKLPALVDYELSLEAPTPPRGSFNREAAKRGEHVFRDAGCASCHTKPAFTDVLRSPGHREPLLHAPAETGMEPLYALRSATNGYRTAPLRGVWQHPPYFHDGSAKDLPAVVEHYNTVKSLGLTPQQQADLVEYLKSL